MFILILHLLQLRLESRAIVTKITVTYIWSHGKLAMCGIEAYFAIIFSWQEKVIN